MIEVQGKFYDGKSSRSQEALLRFSNEKKITIHFPENSEYSTMNFFLQDTKAHPPLGTSARVLEFSDGSRFESFQIDKMKRIVPYRSSSKIVQTLESSLSLALACTFALIMTLALIYIFIIPKIAEHLAYQAPDSFLKATQNLTIKHLEHSKWFKGFHEKLSPKESWAKPVFKNLEQNYSDLNIKFVVMDAKIGPNAFALSAGKVLVTTKLLDLLKNQPNKVKAVLLHEIGHIKYRHGIKGVIQSAGVFVLLNLGIGVADFGSLPLSVLKLSYSRDNEIQADQFAVKQLIQADLPAHLLSDSLKEISDFQKKKHPHQSQISIFSSHPLTKKRISLIKKTAQNFHKK